MVKRNTESTDVKEVTPHDVKMQQIHVCLDQNFLEKSAGLKMRLAQIAFLCSVEPGIAVMCAETVQNQTLLVNSAVPQIFD